MSLAKQMNVDVRAHDLDLGIEALESRQLLAGSLEISVAAGHLVIEGDAQPNHFVIDQTGLATDQYRVTPTGNTQIVGHGGNPVIYTGVTRDLRIRLGEGDDGFVISDAKFRDLRVDDVGGNNGIAIANHSELRNAVINNGDGSDLNLFQEVVFAGQLKINNGNGGSSNLIGYDTIIHGNVSIDNGDGYDETTLNDNQLKKNVTIRNEDGGSKIVTSYAEIDGRLRITNEGGNDWLSMEYGRIAKSVIMSNADGGTDFDMTGTRVWGDLRVRATEGTTAVSITHQTFGHTIVGGNMVFSMGSGQSTTFQLKNFTVNKSLTLRTDAMSSIGLETVAISGKTMIRTGDSPDVIEVKDGTYAKRFTLITGGGNDDVELDRNGNPTWDTRFYGSILLNLGDGDDCAFLGNSADDNNVDIRGRGRFIGGSGDNDMIDYRFNDNVFEVPATMVQFEFEN